MSMNEKSVIVVGGGAAGLAAAIGAARNGAHVTVLEAAKRIGQKILKTGNGRCNLTNAHVRPDDFNDPAYVMDVLHRYPSKSIQEFFKGLGLLTVEEEEGRIYPLSNTASSVLDVLRDACARLGVEVICEQKVTDVHPCDAGYSLSCSDGTAYQAKKVIVATGGATKLLACLGHEIAPFEPALCPVKTETSDLKGLSGVRARANVRATRSGEARQYFEQRGEVLFRDYGLSGIVIFDLSREARAGDVVHLDFVSMLSAEEYRAFLCRKLESMCACNANAEITYADLLRGSFHARLNNAIIRQAGFKPSQLVDEALLVQIACTAKDFKLEVTGPGDPRQAQVTRGGAVVDEFNEKTLESKLAPGVFAAGETLNIDGRCGGFNLHWAWASGLASGAHAAESLEG